MSKYLFIGGPKDAERLEVPDDQIYWQIVERDSLTFNQWESFDVGSYQINYTKHVYTKTPLQNNNGGKYYVFIYTDVNDLMKILIDGYRKGKRRSKKKLKLY